MKAATTSSDHSSIPAASRQRSVEPKVDIELEQIDP